MSHGHGTTQGSVSLFEYDNREPVRSILGRPVYAVADAEELLWRVAQFLDRSETKYARENLRARILKALDGDDWREELTDEDVERYA